MHTTPCSIAACLPAELQWHLAEGEVVSSGALHMSRTPPFTPSSSGTAQPCTAPAAAATLCPAALHPASQAPMLSGTEDSQQEGSALHAMHGTGQYQGPARPTCGMAAQGRPALSSSEDRWYEDLHPHTADRAPHNLGGQPSHLRRGWPAPSSTEDGKQERLEPIQGTPHGVA